MGYLRCEACGSKALSAASTCPKCAAAFDLHDGRGQRVELKKCSGCGIMHRRDRSCHWCGERQPAVWRNKAALRSATGIAAVALVAVGSWAIREPAANLLADAFALAASQTSGQTLAQLPPASPSPAGSPSATMPVDSAPLLSLAADSTVTASADGALATADSVDWEPAVARTWVNVRRDAGRGGDVVGVIKPSEKAMLGGVGRAGWRQVKSPDMSGWVDPRLFDADSIRTRG
jgi:hypothetical protein